jgi:hypothetical protein
MHPSFTFNLNFWYIVIGINIEHQVGRQAIHLFKK